MTASELYPWQQPNIQRHSLWLGASFRHWTGEDLIPTQPDPQQFAYDLFHTPFVLLSHGLESDPILNYGNQQALNLWQVSWQELIQMPSRHTAAPTEQQDRSRLLKQAAQQGYINNYQGVRISKLGRRFLVLKAQIWDVLDDQGNKYGQAAQFDQWQWL
ncbi:MAG: MEKHLA domain-containing protein [Acaryochloridaceae cyanobacterium SU_2_1]|nr:MEKHLA domain-containing protein [Acaryochloridaceae cyanobacterium SU_2_1]